jgi:hypothetical protein|tara:strand:+ start:1097 stop:1216 length:120 start_codon:yes stop_codon:yes gene_type:complete
MTYLDNDANCAFVAGETASDIVCGEFEFPECPAISDGEK